MPTVTRRDVITTLGGGAAGAGLTSLTTAHTPTPAPTQTPTPTGTEQSGYTVAARGQAGSVDVQALATTGCHAIATSNTGHLYHVTLPTLNEQTVTRPHTGRVVDAVIHDGVLATASFDTTVTLHHLTPGLPHIGTFPRHTNRVYGVTLDHERGYSVGWDNRQGNPNLRVWDRDTHHQVATRRLPGNLTFARRHGEYLYVGGHDGTLWQLNPASLETVASVSFDTSLNDIAFHPPSGRVLVDASDTEAVIATHTIRGLTPLGATGYGGQSIEAVHVAPDGTGVIAGVALGGVIVFDAITNTHHALLDHPGPRTESAAATPDGILTGDHAGVLRWWTR